MSQPCQQPWESRSWLEPHITLYRRNKDEGLTTVLIFAVHDFNFSIIIDPWMIISPGNQFQTVCDKRPLLATPVILMILQFT